MLALNHTIRLWVVRRRHLLGDAQRVGEGGPQLGRELPPLVRNDGGRDPEPGHPMAQEGFGTGFGRNIRKGKCLKPAGVPIDHSQKIGTTLRFWERTDQV